MMNEEQKEKEKSAPSCPAVKSQNCMDKRGKMQKLLEREWKERKKNAPKKGRRDNRVSGEYNNNNNLLRTFFGPR